MAHECLKYKIPEDILAKIPKHFWAAFAGELVSLFSPSVFEKNIDSEPILLNTIAGTGGWNAALKITCKKLGMDWLYAYYNNLPWYASDMFDGEFEDLIIANVVDVEWSSMNDYYEWLIGLETKSGYCPICDKTVKIRTDSLIGNCPECGHNVVISRCKNCGHIDISWMRQDDTEKIEL